MLFEKWFEEYMNSMVRIVAWSVDTWLIEDIIISVQPDMLESQWVEDIPLKKSVWEVALLILKVKEPVVRVCGEAFMVALLKEEFYFVKNIELPNPLKVAMILGLESETVVNIPLEMKEQFWGLALLLYFLIRQSSQMEFVLVKSLQARPLIQDSLKYCNTVIGNGVESSLSKGRATSDGVDDMSMNEFLRENGLRFKFVTI
ncbi:hypothetical protein HAX54_011651 [Datura stramonium]|uniref:Uncharacterized protein n=1 Tax=Datura stramonium TaxID=4076 RepID=A0ABS8TK72_DATST|nr:hypothetical protein [Datura stramonium]